MTPKTARTSQSIDLVRRLMLVASLSYLLSGTPLCAQETQEKIDVDGLARTFIVHLPQGYDPQKHYPVVVMLHGENQDADDMSRLTHFSQFAEKNGVIAVYPDAARGKWNIGVRPEAEPEMARSPYGRRRGYPGGGYPGGGYPGGSQNPGGDRGNQNPDENKNRPEPADDVAFLNQMLDQIALKYAVDTHRIYAAGLGDGGFMALRAGCTMADRIAAVAAVSAELPKTMICLPQRPIGAVFIEGTDDPIAPYQGGMYKTERFRLLSAEESSKTWAKFDRCSEKPAQGKLAAPQKGGKETKTLTFSDCHENAQVMLYTIRDGGHTWPGGEQYSSEKEVGKVSYSLNANETVWGFLSTKSISAESGAQK